MSIVRTACLGVIATTLFLSIPAFGEDNADTAKLKAASAAFGAALSKRDLAALDVLWAQDDAVTILHPPSKAVIVGWPAVRKSWEGLFANYTEISLEMKDPNVRVVGNMALVTGAEKFRAKRPNGDINEFLAPTTDVYERRGDQWLLVHHHASRAPQ